LDDIDAVFAALAHEARRQIVLLLAHHGPELPSGYLASRLSHSWPTTTRHLHVLEEAGLVTVRREGRSSIYRLERERLQHVVGRWVALLDPPTPDEVWRSPNPRSTNRQIRTRRRSSPGTAMNVDGFA
jgi:DNA-binding transcriptional ArsR family regulator